MPSHTWIVDSAVLIEDPFDILLEPSPILLTTRRQTDGLRVHSFSRAYLLLPAHDQSHCLPDYHLVGKLGIDEGQYGPRRLHNLTLLVLRILSAYT